MFARPAIVLCVILLAVTVVGCPSPPVCGSDLKHLSNICDYPTNAFRQVIADNPALAPNSAAIISRQVIANKENTNVLISTGGWSHPVYYTGKEQAKNTYVTLNLDGRPTFDGIKGAGPFRWLHCIHAGAEGDGHCTVVDEADGCVYEFWMLNKNLLVADPEAGWAAGMPFTDKTAVWEPGEGIGSNAGGALVYASSVWPDECTSGFNHGFMFGCGWSVNNPSKISKPFYHADGSGTHEDDLHQGMRVQLNPGYDVSRLPLYQRTIAQAFKTFGMYDGNSNGGNWGIYGINKNGYTNNPWNGVLPDPNAESFSTGVPVAQFRVLKPDFTDLRGEPQNNSCITYKR